VLPVQHMGTVIWLNAEDTVLSTFRFHLLSNERTQPLSLPLDHALLVLPLLLTKHLCFTCPPAFTRFPDWPRRVAPPLVTVLRENPSLMVFFASLVLIVPFFFCVEGTQALGGSLVPFFLNFCISDFLA